MAKRAFTIREPIYSADIWVSAGWPWKEAEKRINKLLNANNTEETESLARTLFIPGFMGCCIWFQKCRPTPCIIAHESFHATTHILKSAGVKFSANSEEAFAYLIAYLVREIHRKL